MSKNIIIGIDLGTTHSLVAYVNQKRPQIIKTRAGHNLLPSVIHLSAEGPVLGYGARQKKITDPTQTLFSVKRLLGLSYQDLKEQQKNLPYQIIPNIEDPLKGQVQIQVGQSVYSPIELSSMILRELKLSAEQELGVPIQKAVVTVPAYFNDSQRQATKVAGQLAGLDVLRIVNEPTAAALAYGLDQKQEALIAVYDLGGGTFDISILRLHQGVFEVLSTAGDTALGGDDFDRMILAEMAPKCQKNGVDIWKDPNILAAALDASEKCKIELSQNQKAIWILPLPNQTLSYQITQQEFKNLVYPLLKRTENACLRALDDAGCFKNDITDVVMVGGSTRLSIVREMAENIFEKPVNISMHPDEVVALGAAIQGDILAGNNKETLLLDVVPLSLGMETYGGLTSVLISRNSKIPTSAKEVFTTFVDYQTAVDIHVLQGERERAHDNRSLAKFKLKVPPMPAGQARVEVCFLVDADGVLNVTAKELKTGQSMQIEVKSTLGLDQNEVQKMIELSKAHLSGDGKFRRLVEAKNLAEPILRSTEKALKQVGQKLNEDERHLIFEVKNQLKDLLEHGTAEEILQTKVALENATVRLAELVISDALEKANAALEQGAGQKGVEGHDHKPNE